MHVYLNYNFEVTCRAVLQNLLDGTGRAYSIADTGCVHFQEPLPAQEFEAIASEMAKFGIEIIDNRKMILVRRIKEAITTMLLADETLQIGKISAFLTEQLGESYRSLSNTFSEVCHISIESFVILHKIEIVKRLLAANDLSLTEISYKLNYSSVAHLSAQFKKTTGLTPTAFQKIIRHKRKNRTLNAK